MGCDLEGGPVRILPVTLALLDVLNVHILEAGIMPASLGAVPTRIHRAPTAAAVLALVDEQVATAPVILAFPDAT